MKSEPIESAGAVGLEPNFLRSRSFLGCHEAKRKWAFDQWLSRAKGLIVVVSPNQSDRKGNNKVSKCKSKKYLFGNKT